MMDEDNIWHVYPNNDLKEHITECTGYNAGGLKAYCNCECKPDHQIIMKDGIPNGILVVHNSFDGREGGEWANEILNKNK